MLTVLGGLAAHREAVRLVRRHWDVIERVADALTERGRLSGAEVDALTANFLQAALIIDASRDPIASRRFDDSMKEAQIVLSR